MILNLCAYLGEPVPYANSTSEEAYKAKENSKEKPHF